VREWDETTKAPAPIKRNMQTSSYVLGNTPHSRPPLPNRYRIPPKNHQQMGRGGLPSKPSHNTRRRSSPRNRTNPPRKGRSRGQYFPHKNKSPQGGSPQ
jgi:hypothetical protein